MPPGAKAQNLRTNAITATSSQRYPERRYNVVSERKNDESAFAVLLPYLFVLCDASHKVAREYTISFIIIIF